MDVFTPLYVVEQTRLRIELTWISSRKKRKTNYLWRSFETYSIRWLAERVIVLSGKPVDMGWPGLAFPTSLWGM
jgi:hypothetical protein